MKIKCKFCSNCQTRDTRFNKELEKSIFYLAICSAVALRELIGIASQITNDIFDTAFKGIFVFML